MGSFWMYLTLYSRSMMAWRVDLVHIQTDSITVICLTFQNRDGGAFCFWAH